jgi:hypothetical protein
MELRQTDIISNSLDNISLCEGDKIIIIVSQSMIIVGAYIYNKEKNIFIRNKEINKVVSLFYDVLPMVEFINENTYKMFSKRLREIDQENYEAFLKNVDNTKKSDLKNQNNYKKTEEFLSNINQSFNKDKF